MASKTNPVFDFLHKTKLADLSVKSAHTLLATQSVEDAVDLFTAQKIHSAPVVDAEGNILGMIDMLDIVWSILKVAPTPEAITADELKSLETAGRAMAWESLSDVIGRSGRDPLEPIFETNPATHALGIFATGIHRVPLHNANNEIVGAVSQGAVLAHVAAKMMEHPIKEFVNQDVKALGLSAANESSIIKVYETETVLKACQTLLAASVNAAAVVDASGCLIGNFSAFDLRSLYKEQLPELTSSVKAFLTKHSPTSLQVLKFAEEGSSTLADAISKLNDEHVRRLWITNAAGHPTGVISTTDICRVFNRTE